MKTTESAFQSRPKSSAIAAQVAVLLGGSREPTLKPTPPRAFASHRPVERRARPAERLTPRQREVLALLGEGLSNKEISRRLDISGCTVKVHVSWILRELGAASRLEAIVVANREGLLGWEPLAAVEQPHEPVAQAAAY